MQRPQTTPHIIVFPFFRAISALRLGTFIAAVLTYNLAFSAPNLTPYQPSGWSDKIVVSKVTGTTTDSSPLYTTNSLYVDWAVINNGSSAVTAVINFALYVDGSLHQTYTLDPPLNANTYTHYPDDSIGSLTAGTHTITITADYTGTIAESNEGDNSYTKTITVLAAPAPANDQCSGAIAMASGVTYTMNTGAATSTGDPVPSCQSNFGKGVWYKFTPASEGQVTVSTCGSSFDTVVSVYTGSCGSLQPVSGGCNDDSGPSCASTQASVTFQGTNTTYWILAGGYNSGVGNLQINLTFIPAPSNNRCAGAIALSRGVAYGMDTTYATSTGDPVPTCQTNFGKGVWFSFGLAYDAQITIDTCGSSFDTVLSVYTGNCGSLQPVSGGCNDDNGPVCTNTQASVSFPGTSNTTYWILVGGFAGASGSLQITANAPTPPLVIACPGDTSVFTANDLPFADASSVQVTSGCSPYSKYWLGDDSSFSDRVLRSYQVYDSCGQIQTCTQTFYLTCQKPSGVQISVVSQTPVTDGIQVHYSASAFGSSPLSFSWSADYPYISSFPSGSDFYVTYSATQEYFNGVHVSVSNPCGGAGGDGGTTVSCGICLSRGTPSLVTGTTGSGTGPLIATANCGTLTSYARWYKLIASDTGPVTVSSEGSSNPAVIAVYTGALTALSPMTCAPTNKSRLTFNATNGVVYWIAVDPHTFDTSNLRVGSGFEPKIQSITWQTNGTALLQSTLYPPPIPYGVLASTNISSTNWSVVYTTNLSINSSNLIYRETNSKAFPRRFYKLGPTH